MSESVEIKNAVIKTATITAEDHGCLSAWLDLDYGGAGQGFGGFNLYSPPGEDRKVSANYAGHFIWRVMQVAGVTRWSDLPGKTIRVKSSHFRISAIGHVIKNDWFDPRSDFDQIERGEL